MGHDERTRRIDWSSRRTRVIAGALTLLLLGGGLTAAHLLDRPPAPDPVAADLATSEPTTTAPEPEPAVVTTASPEPSEDPSPEPTEEPAPEPSEDPSPEPTTQAPTTPSPPARAKPTPSPEPTRTPDPEPTSTRAAAPAAPTATPVWSAGRIVELTNAERRSAGLSDLAASECGAQQARERVAVLIAEGRFEHDPLGPVLSACAARGVGENIALGYANEDAVVAGWMGSDGHRRNILGDYTSIGVACAQGPRGVLCMQVFLR